MKRKNSGGETPESKRKKKNFIIANIETADHENFNEYLTKPLEQIGLIEKNKGDGVRYRAYLQAVASLKAHPKKIESGKEARELKGIGVKIEQKIQEIIDTGKSSRLEKDLGDENIIALNEISKVFGIGPKIAPQLIFDHGVKTVEDLRNLKDGILNKQQKLGLKYFDDLNQKIPRAEIKKIIKIIRNKAIEIDDKIIINCCGSYRRKLPQSGDIDILMSHPKYNIEEKDKKNTFSILKNLVKKLYEIGLLVEDFSNGDSKYMGICKLEDSPVHRHIDIKLIPIESYFLGLCHATGSGEHNRKLRAVAQLKNYKLNEYGLYPEGSTGVFGEDSIPILCEKDIFDILGLDYKTPQERNL